MKILFLQEYMRESHIRQENSGEMSNIFLSTKGGSILKKLVKDGLGLSYDDFYIDYAYGLVPKVITRDKYGKAVKYKQPTAREANAEYEYLYRKIVSEKPDIIIPTGNLGCKALIGKSSISQLRGVPVKSAFSNGQENFETWVMPMYSMEYMLVNPSVQNLIEADFVTLKKFVDTGEAAFEASPVEYEFVTSMERVREIFNVEVTKAPSVAWDLETNTLHPELKGAKPLVVSLSWEEGTGCTIPLEHKDFTWNFYELDEIYKLLEDFVGNPDIPKEGHNIKYDMRFLRLTKGFKRFRNNRDTMIMYYLLINQEVESSLRLSDLSYELTDMGGYDKALEEYKKKFIEDSIETAKAIKEKMQEEHKKAQAAEKALAKVERRKAIKLEKPEYPSTAAPVNEIDGEDFNYEWIPLVEMIHPYASGDVDACLRIFNRLDAIGQKPENAKIRQLYLEHYPELINVLAKIEANGIMMDTAYTEGLIEAYTKESDRLVEEMRIFPEVQQLEAEHLALYQRGLEEMAIPKKDRNEEIADLRDKYKNKLVFNPNSSDDKKKILFQYTGNTLPYNKEMIVESALENNIPEDEIQWFHYKADKVALAYVIENYPESKELAALLLEHSKVKTLKQNFTYKLLAMIDHDGLLHGGFNPAGTATSRLSSSSPNLQQMPRKTGDVYRFDYHHPIKRMFVTSFEGGALIQADYSSLESRVLALAAYDEEMIQAFLDNVDIHRETASLVFGIPKEQVTDDQRSSAKSTTFGIAYGETPFSYYAKHGMTLDQAEKLFEDFFRNKPRIKMFIDENHAQVKQDGHVECLQGFRRNLRDVYSQDRSKQNGALRQSVNTKIQGSGAFLTNTAVIYINKFIEEHNLRSKLVLTVHDSIVCDSPPEEIHIMSRAIIYIMENLPIDWLFIDWKGEKLRFPIAADLEIGVNYNDMVDYNMEEINSFQTVKSYCKFKLDLKKIKNYKESKAITEEKFDAMKAAIENNKPQYQMAI